MIIINNIFFIVILYILLYNYTFLIINLFYFSGFNMQQVPVSTQNSGVPAVSIFLV